MLEGDLPAPARRGVSGLGAVSNREVLARSEGSRDDVGRVRGVVEDADPGPRLDVALGVKPQKNFRDCGDLTR
eukprot:8868464-Alexandrium_andersonii.AAC.1